MAKMLLQSHSSHTVTTYTCISYAFVPRCRMDLQLVPLRIELHARLIFEMSLPWGGRIRKVLINKRLWFYQTKTINKEIFNINDAEPDNSPPDFSIYSTAVSVYDPI